MTSSAATQLTSLNSPRQQRMELTKFLTLTGMLPLPFGLGTPGPGSTPSTINPQPSTERNVHMPITSAGSYLPVTQEFLNHWDQVNTALGSPLTLSGGYAIADLTSDRASIQAALTATEGS